MYEGARRGSAVGLKCSRVVDNTPLTELWLPYERLNPTGKGPHVTEVMEHSAGEDKVNWLSLLC